MKKIIISLMFLFCSCSTIYQIHSNSVSKENVEKMPSIYEQIYDEKKCVLCDTTADKKGFYNIKCKHKTIIDWLYEVFNE